MRLPQTIGLECARPGIVVRQRMFWPVFVFHSSGRFCPSATPDAFGPRNDGQLPVAFAGRDGGRAPAVLTKFRSGLGTDSPAGSQVLPSRMSCRTLHSSETTPIVTCLPSEVARYLPRPSQPPGAFANPASESSNSAP